MDSCPIPLCAILYYTRTISFLCARAAIGIAAEVNSTTSFVDKLGLGKANEVLYWGKKTPVEELLKAGFVKWVFGCPASGSLFNLFTAKFSRLPPESRALRQLKYQSIFISKFDHTSLNKSKVSTLMRCS